MNLVWDSKKQKYIDQDTGQYHDTFVQGNTIVPKPPTSPISDLLTSPLPSLEPPKSQTSFSSFLPALDTYTPSVSPSKFAPLYANAYKTAGYKTAPSATDPSGFYIMDVPAGSVNQWGTISSGVTGLEAEFAKAMKAKYGRYPTPQEARDFVEQTVNEPFAQAGVGGSLTSFKKYIDPYLLANQGSFAPPPAQMGLSQFTPDISNLLSISNILNTVNKPLMSTVNDLIAPQVPVLQALSDTQTAAAIANAKSEFTRRGIRDSSTDLQTILRDLPSEAQKNVSMAIADLLAKSTATAMEQKKLETSTSVTLRSLISDEQFKTMTLDQQERFKTDDISLARELKQLEIANDQKQLDLKIAYQKETDQKERDLIAQLMRKQEERYADARKAAFTKGLISLGFGVGGAVLGAFSNKQEPLTGAKEGFSLGKDIGGVTGELFSF